MKAFFDTSVLVPLFYEDHEHHTASFTALLKFSKSEVTCGAHSLAEVYSTLTRMPGRRRVDADQAVLFLESLRERLTITSLTSDDYFRALATCADLSITGGAVYDGILAACAKKAAAKTIYTWNIKHYSRMQPMLNDATIQTP